MYVYTGDDGRILAVVEDEKFADGYEEFDIPEGFDIYRCDEYRIVDGEPVHDPPQPTEVELAAQEEVERRAQASAAVPMLARMMAASMTDAQLLTVPLLFEDWSAEGAYAEGDVVRYGGKLWRCREKHDAQESWTPDQAHSLWEQVLEPGAVEEWRQPQPGVFDGYNLGERCTHNGKTWESTYDGLNVWEPGATGSEALWKEVDE